MAGTTHGLVLGGHRVLDRLGAGGMGIVFLAEHMFMKRQVALKVMPVDDDCPPELLQRFYSEVRVLAQLQHANIVTAFDGGLLRSQSVGLPSLVYLAMELVDGGDLEKYVQDHGPLPVGQACDWICQAALGLQEAHDHHLIHRDIKPSNLLRTSRNQIKLVDFGLVRQFSCRLTDPNSVLGTIEYMPPEQSVDSSAVGTAADIYSLGATLFWLLTGEPPYGHSRNASKALQALREAPARCLRTLRPEVPRELETVVGSLLEKDPTRRPALALTVYRALLPFAA